MNATIAIDHEVLTLEELSKLLRLHRSTVYKLVSEGRIPGFQIGSGWRFRKDMIVRWLAARSWASPSLSEVIEPRAGCGPPPMESCGLGFEEAQPETTVR